MCCKIRFIYLSIEDVVIISDSPMTHVWFQFNAKFIFQKRCSWLHILSEIFSWALKKITD